MPPRPTLEPDDLVTPTRAGRLLGVPASTVRTWIERYHLEPLGTLGRWPAYDYNDIAAVDARLRRKREAQPAALHAPPRPWGEGAVQSYLPLITGSGGALVVLAIVAYLLGVGKLHSDAEYQRIADENRDLRTALETERTTNNELARAGGVTNKLIGALVDVATDRHDTDRHREGAHPPPELTAGDLGL